MSDTIARLSALIEEQVVALRQGELGRLAPLARDMEALAEGLEEANVDAASLRLLNGRARHALVLVEATLEGIREAERRIDRARRASETLDTYDPQGRPRTLPIPTATGYKT